MRPSSESSRATLRLNDICTAIVDCEHKTASEGDGYALSVGTRAMKQGRLVIDACKPVSEETYINWSRRMVPVEGDLVLAREAPVGQVIRVPRWPRICLGQRTVLIRANTARVHPRFLHYWLLGPDAQGPMAEQAGGATVAHLNVDDIRRLDVSKLPQDRKHQRAVAETLGAIDDLIENNRRRVELLEEMARVIYREWFVHFRYPSNNEKAALIESPLGLLPEDWAARKVGKVARLVRGRSYRTTELVKSGGLPFVNLKCMMRGGGFRRDGLKRYAGTYSADQCVRTGDIVLAVTDLTQGREILARATLVPPLEEDAVISLDVVRLVPSRDDDRLWLFAALFWSDFADRVKEYANGSTVLHLAPVHITECLLPWPSAAIRTRFIATLRPIISSIDVLNSTSEMLAAKRDLLLPKLVTGQINVSQMNPDSLVKDLVP